MIGLVGLERSDSPPPNVGRLYTRASDTDAHHIALQPRPLPDQDTARHEGRERSGGALFVRAGGRQTTAGCANIARLGKSAIVMSSAEHNGARRAAQAPPAPEIARRPACASECRWSAVLSV